MKFSEEHLPHRCTMKDVYLEAMVMRMHNISWFKFSHSTLCVLRMPGRNVARAYRNRPPPKKGRVAQWHGGTSLK